MELADSIVTDDSIVTGGVRNKSSKKKEKIIKRKRLEIKISKFPSRLGNRVIR